MFSGLPSDLYSSGADGLYEVREIRKIVKDIDSNAFIVITNAREVFGEGFKET